MSLTPRKDPGKAEWHLTYGCNLACISCNRASFLRQPHTPDMTVTDALEFCRQARQLQWFPSIMIIGGEPTLHPDFLDFCEIARRHVGARGLVQIWSNGHTERARQLLEVARKRFNCSIAWETQKPEGSVNFTRPIPGAVEDMYVSPTDYGLPLRKPCFQHASIICGVSVDHYGYAPCALGGTIAGLLGDKARCRTRVLADLFDPEKVSKLTEELCRHCGYQLSLQGAAAIPGLEISEWRQYVESLPKVRGTRMSPTWQDAFRGRS
jgi:hypothetical protein